MIFELWGNIGLRKGDYKLWADAGREFTPGLPALVNKLKNSDLALFDLAKTLPKARISGNSFPRFTTPSSRN